MKKRIFSIVLILILFIYCFAVAGCNNGFELVKSITITTNGETKRFGSSVEPDFYYTSSNIINEEDYNNAPIERKLASGTEKIKKASNITVEEAFKLSKNSTRYEVVEEQLEGFWYKMNFNIYTKKYNYLKLRYGYTYFNFVYAKIKNDTTIAIRQKNVETTYSVTSYSIVKF